MVAHGAPVQAAPLGGGALVAALTGALDFGLTLREETTRSALEFTGAFFFLLKNPQMRMMKECEAERDGEDLKELLRRLLFVCVCLQREIRGEGVCLALLRGNTASGSDSKFLESAESWRFYRRCRCSSSTCEDPTSAESYELYKTFSVPGI